MYSLLARCFKDYRRNAFRREIDWCLTFEEFKDLITRSCFYCNAPPKRLKRTHRAGNGSDIPIISREKFTGVDRLDSDGAYTLKNCVPCCKRCNVGKGTMAPEEWISHCRRVARFQPP